MYLETMFVIMTGVEFVLLCISLHFFCLVDDLLPLVHFVWKPFVNRFSDEEPLVTIKAGPHFFTCCLYQILLATVFNFTWLNSFIKYFVPNSDFSVFVLLLHIVCTFYSY